jgi:hypothetical protein
MEVLGQFIHHVNHDFKAVAEGTEPVRKTVLDDFILSRIAPERFSKLSSSEMIEEHFNKKFSDIIFILSSGFTLLMAGHSLGEILNDPKMDQMKLVRLIASVVMVSLLLIWMLKRKNDPQAQKYLAYLAEQKIAPEVAKLLDLTRYLSETSLSLVEPVDFPMEKKREILAKMVLIRKMIAANLEGDNVLNPEDYQGKLIITAGTLDRSREMDRKNIGKTIKEIQVK